MKAIVVGKEMGRGIFAIRGAGGYNVCICELKEGLESGDPFNYADVKSIIALIHFKDRESVDKTMQILGRVASEMAKDAESRGKKRRKRR